MLRKGLFLALCFVVSINAAAYEKKLGVAFSLSNQASVGLKWHINNLYCVHPHFGFHYSDAANGNTEMLIGIGNQFYLPSFAVLDQYINIVPAFYLNGNQGNFEATCSYGLQYQFNSTISIFGELGIAMTAPHFQIGTFRSGVGVIFYIN